MDPSDHISESRSRILDTLIRREFIDNNWTESERMFAINICENNMNYVKDNWQHIKESKIQDMLIISAKTNDLIFAHETQIDDNFNESIFAFLNTVWKIHIKYVNKFGNNCLMIACGSGNLSKIKYLINEIKMDKNHKNKHSRNCLQCACATNTNLEIVKYLIDDLGMDVNNKNNDGSNCLLSSAANSNLEIIKYLITEVGMDKNVIDYHNDNILTWACMYNDNVEMIKYIVNDLGMSLDHVTENGNNCLHIACGFNQNLDIIKYLINELKFDINTMNGDGINCVMVACQHNENLNIIKYLIDLKNDQSDINNYFKYACIYNKNLDIIKYMVKNMDINMNWSNDIGTNYLLATCQKSKELNKIKYLINDLKMDTNYIDRDGNNCFLAHCINKTPSIDIIKYLIKDVGMDINYMNDYEQSALFFLDDDNIIQYLINEENVQISSNIFLSLGFNKFDNIMQLTTNYKKYNKFISDGLTIYSHQKMLSAIKKRNPFELSRYHKKIFKINPFVENDYKKCIGMIDRLTEKVSIPNLPRVREKTNKIIAQDDPELLFLHNGNKFYGHRDIVFNAMCLFNEMFGPIGKTKSNMMRYEEIITLEGNLSKNTMNQYISSSYTGSINFNHIPCEEFIEFLKFIDQYPTFYCSIKINENQIVRYINKNKVPDSDYLKYLCEKYQLKSMYLNMHNKKF